MPIDLHYTDCIGHRVQTQAARLVVETGEDRSSHEMRCTLLNGVAANREKFHPFNCRFGDLKFWDWIKQTKNADGKGVRGC